MIPAGAIPDPSDLPRKAGGRTLRGRRSSYVYANEVAAVRRAARIVAELNRQLKDRDHLTPALRQQIATASTELTDAAEAAAVLLDRQGHPDHDK